MSHRAEAPRPDHSVEIDLGPARTLLQAFDAEQSDAPAVLLVPALGVPARHYLALGGALARHGVQAMVLDLRGVGSSSVRARRGLDWGYLDLVDIELVTLYQRAAARWPAARLHWLGHSLGGQLCVLHQARHPQQRADSVVLAASGSPWVRTFDPPMRWLVQGFAAVVAASAAWLGVFRGDWFRFGGRQGAQLMGEWSRFCRGGRLELLGSERWDADRALAVLKRPLLGLSMAGDSYAPQRSTERLAAMTAGNLQLSRIEEVDSQRPGHFLWLRHPDAVAAIIGRFVRAARAEG